MSEGGVQSTRLNIVEHVWREKSPAVTCVVSDDHIQIFDAEACEKWLS